MEKSLNYPSISVVVPSYNQGQYIEETLLSIFGQQYPNLEVLVLDGGSDDNTVEMLKKYSNQISYWHSKKDEGQADAINQGMNMSSGQILCWLNSDDMYLPGTLLDIAKRFKEKIGSSYLIHGDAISMNQSLKSSLCFAERSCPMDKFKLTYACSMVQPSSFWTREVWQQAGNLNTNYRYTLDWDWFIRASKVAKFDYVQKFYSVYRYHPLHKTTRENGPIRRKEIIDIVKKYSSDEWSNVYTEVDKNYDKVIRAIENLEAFKIPKKINIILDVS